MYVQGTVNAVNLRAPFDQDTSVGGWLAADNTLLNTLAVWLNDTGLPVHMESTMLITYRFVKAGGEA